MRAPRHDSFMRMLDGCLGCVAKLGKSRAELTLRVISSGYNALRMLGHHVPVRAHDFFLVELEYPEAEGASAAPEYLCTPLLVVRF